MSKLFTYGGWYKPDRFPYSTTEFKRGHFEVELVRTYSSPDKTVSSEVVQEGEQLTNSGIYHWSTYLRDSDGLAVCIGNFKTCGEAHCYGEQVIRQIDAELQQPDSNDLSGNGTVAPSEGWGGRIEQVYDPAIHDGQLEGPYAICEDSDGNVIDTDDDPEWFHMADYFSVMIHRRTGGTDTVGDFQTAKEAQDYIDAAAKFLESKGVVQW